MVTSQDWLLNNPPMGVKKRAGKRKIQPETPGEILVAKFVRLSDYLPKG